MVYFLIKPQNLGSTNELVYLLSLTQRMVEQEQKVAELEAVVRAN
ncbi:hypothetical protein [Moorena producens]